MVFCVEIAVLREFGDAHIKRMAQSYSRKISQGDNSGNIEVYSLLLSIYLIVSL